MLRLSKTKILVQYKINYIEEVSNMSFRYIEIDEKGEIRNDIGDRKEEKVYVRRTSAFSRNP